MENISFSSSVDSCFNGLPSSEDANEPVLLPKELRGYVRYIVVRHPGDRNPYSIGVKYVQNTEGAQSLLAYLIRNVNRKHKKHVHSWLCQSAVDGSLCELGFQCPNIHVTPDGYSGRREWLRPLKGSRSGEKTEDDDHELCPDPEGPESEIACFRIRSESGDTALLNQKPSFGPSTTPSPSFSTTPSTDSLISLSPSAYPFRPAIPLQPLKPQAYPPQHAHPIQQSENSHVLPLDHWGQPVSQYLPRKCIPGVLEWHNLVPPHVQHQLSGTVELPSQPKAQLTGHFWEFYSQHAPYGHPICGPGWGLVESKVEFPPPPQDLALRQERLRNTRASLRKAVDWILFNDNSTWQDQFPHTRILPSLA